MGRMFLILTVTGAKTGNRYTTPVQYARDGDLLLALSRRTRRWWRKLEDARDRHVGGAPDGRSPSLVQPVGLVGD